MFFSLEFSNNLLATNEVLPINCTLTSEEVREIKVVLTERGSSALIGNLFYKDKKIVIFKTSKPTAFESSTWQFERGNQKFKGEILLFKGDILWHKYQNIILSKDVNRAIFSGLSSKLNLFTNDSEILKASSGFFKIGSTCYGGRLNKA